jgi:hypothetical protein
MTVPEQCDRAGCTLDATTWCPLCTRFFCAAHDQLPDGHICLASFPFNGLRVLDEDEVEAALEHFQPLP